MKIFGIDTTRKIARVFIFDSENNNFNSISLNENVKHSEGLFLYIEKLLLENKTSLKEMDSFLGVVGPGSFTGIRVGLSTLKGFNKVFNRKTMAINMFEIISSKIKNGVILLNSTHACVYYGEIKGHKLVDAGVIDKDKVSTTYQDNLLYMLKEEQNIIDYSYNNINLIENLDDYYIEAIKSKLNNVENESLEPYYLQLSQAERNLKNE